MARVEPARRRHRSRSMALGGDFTTTPSARAEARPAALAGADRGTTERPPAAKAANGLGTLRLVRIVDGLASLPLDDTPSVVTVGFFDGVHAGHRAVLARAAERGSVRGIRAVA